MNLAIYVWCELWISIGCGFELWGELWISIGCGFEFPGTNFFFLFKVGCGVGNFFYPLLEDGLNLFVYACDFSPRAIEFVESHPMYDETKVSAFQCDITQVSWQKECMDIF